MPLPVLSEPRHIAELSGHHWPLRCAAFSPDGHLLATAAGYGLAKYRFPGRQVLQWALVLPLAVPTYIIAYAYLDLLHPVGIVQTTIRALIGVESPRDFRLPDVRSMTGCVLLLGFVLYPYVYLATRATVLRLPMVYGERDRQRHRQRVVELIGQRLHDRLKQQADSATGLVNTTSDVYSLGAILYEMLSGERAFRGDSQAETMTAIVEGRELELDRVGILPRVERQRGAIVLVARPVRGEEPGPSFESDGTTATVVSAMP